MRTVVAPLRAVDAQHQSYFLPFTLQFRIALLAREPGLARDLEVEGDVRACEERPLSHGPVDCVEVA